MNSILIIDSDSELTDVLSHYLQSVDCTVTVALSGDTGIKKVLNHPFDAIILDLILPEKNGFEVIRSIRMHSNTPIIILTALNKDIDRIVALDIGADDYLVKPCNPRELIARLHAILRRTQKSSTIKPVIEHNHITVNRAQHKAFMLGVDLELTNAEFNILEMLIKTPGQAFSKEELTEYALGRKFTAYDRSIDVHISNLRNKLGDDASGEPWLKTVRGFGYLFNLNTTTK